MTTDETPPTTPPPLPPPATLEPVQEPERIAALDVLRGVAIFGIFMVNMQFFAMPLMDIAPMTSAGDVPMRDYCAWAIVKVFFEYKFISIFSLLFGMGMVVQMRRAEAKGRPFAPVYLRRLLVLMLIGLGHAFLFWYGDILFLYSLVALLVFLVMLFRPSPRVLLILAAVALIGSASVMGGLLAVSAVFGSTWTQSPSSQVEDGARAAGAADAAERAPADEAGDDRWARIQNALKQITEEEDFAASREIEVIAYKEGPLWLALVVRAVTFVFLNLGVVIGGLLFRVIGMFLLGAALMSLDFFARTRRRWHWGMCALGLPLGAIGEFLVLRILWVAGETPWVVFLAEVVHQVASFVLCLGYVGTVTLLVNSGAVPVLGKLFAAVGRMALTNYLLQTLISTALMYWWGLAWFADVSRPQQIWLVLAIFAVQVLGSVVWLRFFSIGPFEWIWRSLTCARAQPIRR